MSSIGVVPTDGSARKKKSGGLFKGFVFFLGGGGGGGGGGGVDVAVAVLIGLIF